MLCVNDMQYFHLVSVDTCDACAWVDQPHRRTFRKRQTYHRTSSEHTSSYACNTAPGAGSAAAPAATSKHRAVAAVDAFLPQLAALQVLVVVAGHCDNCHAAEESSALGEPHLG